MPAPPPPAPHGLDALRTYGEGFAGRTAELAALDRAWAEGVRVFVLHAQGGAGKTRVVARHELGPLLAEAKAGGVRILWVPLRASSYEETDLKDLQAVSPPDQPLAQMSKADRDAAWVRVCKEIKGAVRDEQEDGEP